MSRFLYFISRYLPCKIIRGNEDVPYLERYYLCSLFGRRVYLHRFLGGDVDEATHNHPWLQSYALILCGEYEEETGAIETQGDEAVLQLQRQRRRPLSCNALSHASLHRIVSARPNTWTLFWHTREQIQDWGFLEEDADAGFIIRPHPSSKEVNWEQNAPRGKHCEQRMPYCP